MTFTKFVSRLDMSRSHVDRESGIIKEVSLLTIGEARGYNQYADKKTLEQVRDCAKQYSGGLRIKFNPDTFNHGDGSLAGRMPADTIRIKGDSTVGDIHVYKNYQYREYLFEIAEEAPDNCGLSIHFGGVPEKIGDKEYARCDEIFDATVVDLPAANKRGLYKSKNQDDEIMELNDDTIAKLGKSIAEGLKPVLATENDRVINAFRMAQGSPAQGEPTPEELTAAGCGPDDTPEQVASKVQAFRKKADQPVTMKDLMSFFRHTGGRPAKVSGGAEGEGDGDDKTHPFVRTVNKYKAAGMKEAKAILRARADNGKQYNEWAKAGRPMPKSDNGE